MIPKSPLLLDMQAFVDVHVYIVRLTAPMTWVNDRGSDNPELLPFPCDRQTSDHSPIMFVHLKTSDICFLVCKISVYNINNDNKRSLFTINLINYTI